MKMIIPILILILMSSMAFAAVTRSGGGTAVTYTSTLTGSYTAAYWAVDDATVGCTVTSATCTGLTNVDCDYTAGAIRLVSYTPEAGGTLDTDVTVTVTGSGTCSLNGEYVESSPGNLGSATALTGSVTLDFGVAGCAIYGDTAPACDGIDRTELGAVAQEWMGDPTSSRRTNLGIAAQDWINAGGPA